MFISIIKAVILGIVEGITEFLPISSTGHLIIVNQWISFDADFTKLFDIVIQLGAILSVVVFFWNRLWPFGKDKEKNKEIWSIWFKVVVGVLPAIVLGALLANKIEEKFFNPLTVAIMLIIGGAVLIWVERRKTTPDSKRGLAPFSSVKEISYRTAIYIGFFQCLAMIPGTSRSAATIIGAMLLGASRVVAAEFSFFLAIPTMVAASAYSLLKYKSHITGAETAILAVGFVVSFIVALAVIRFFMNYIQKHSFKNFGVYRIVLGAIILLMFVIGLIK
jgi:undecaprenyl-diphosphatase